MSNVQSAPSLDLVSEIVEKNGDVNCNGLLLIQWQDDNSVTARYAGTELTVAGVITLATNGLQALVASLAASEVKEPSPDLQIVTDTE